MVKETTQNNKQSSIEKKVLNKIKGIKQVYIFHANYRRQRGFLEGSNRRQLDVGQLVVARWLSAGCQLVSRPFMSPKAMNSATRDHCTLKRK